MAADLAIVNARVRTLDPAQPFAEAVAMRGGTIVAVGDDAEVREHCDARTEVLDARGNALDPGPGGLAPASVLGRRARPRDGSQPLPHARGGARRAGGERAAARVAVRLGAGLRRGADAGGDRRGGRRRGRVRAALGPAHRARLAARAASSPRSPARTPSATARRSCASTASRPASCARPARRTSCCAPRPGLRWPELRARHVEQLQRLNALGLTGAHVMDGEPATHDLLRDLEGTEELTCACGCRSG